MCATSGGLQVGHQRWLKIINQRCRTGITWWWPWVMRPKDGFPLMCVFCYINCCICLYSFSLRVFGDDRVHGTQEQMMLQVVLVELKARAWASWEILWQHFII